MPETTSGGPQSFDQWVLSAAQRVEAACAPDGALTPEEQKGLSVEIRLRMRRENALDAKLKCGQLLFQLLEQAGLEDLDALRALDSLGTTAYQAGEFQTAEKLFRKNIALGGKSQNNLAYLLRRNECARPAKTSEVIELLLNGVKQRHSYSLVNMALVFALRLGEERDWKLADQLISLVPEDDVYQPYQWWRNVAKSGDNEGYLVLLFLLRHRKIETCSLGSFEEIGERVRQAYPHAPEWTRTYI